MQILEQTQIEALLGELDDAGKIFPQFELCRQSGKLCLLGRGGFSQVYEMVNLYRPNQYYALKVSGFDKHLQSSDKFLETTRIQRMLSEKNQNIIRIIDQKETSLVLEGFENQIDIQFLLMEKLEGIIVKNKYKDVSLLREQLKDEDEVVQFALQIGKALKAVHDCSVLHRDIKLENIFWDSENECYKLGDFGIAKQSENGSAETVAFTNGYGAPEIGKKIGDSYGVTADIYSFGITLYLLLNDLKFPGSEGYFVRPDVQYDSEVCLPAPLNASVKMTRLIQKMCSYYPENRYQSIDEVLEALIVNSNSMSEEEKEESLQELDIETETYRETKSMKLVDATSSRESRKYREKEEKRIYRFSMLKFGIVSMILFLSFFCGLNDTMVTHPTMISILLTVFLFIDAVLQEIGEFHIEFSIALVAYSIYSAYMNGLSVLHILTILCAVIGLSTLSVSVSLAMGLYLWLVATKELFLLDFIFQYDFTWIVLLLLILFVESMLFVANKNEKVSSTKLQLITENWKVIWILLLAIGGVLARFGGCFDIFNKLHLLRSVIVLLIVYKIKWLTIRLKESEKEEENEHLDEGRN